MTWSQILGNILTSGAAVGLIGLIKQWQTNRNDRAKGQLDLKKLELSGDLEFRRDITSEIRKLREKDQLQEKEITHLKAEVKRLTGERDHLRYRVSELEEENKQQAQRIAHLEAMLKEKKGRN